MLGCFLFLCHQGNFSFGSAIMPSGKDFASVLRLRDEARQAVLAGCGDRPIRFEAFSRATGKTLAETLFACRQLSRLQFDFVEHIIDAENAPRITPGRVPFRFGWHRSGQSHPRFTRANLDLTRIHKRILFKCNPYRFFDQIRAVFLWRIDF